ncbi:MAG: ferritin-like domain-containing protein, partial [Actinobacteria bacterium]|nr:ferritin-like domain-containing protein [Actinomycetota bacterium]
MHLTAWCRREGHAVDPDTGLVVRGRSDVDRWTGAQRAGGPAVSGLVARAAHEWGLAARGALIEAGGPATAGFDIAERDVVWSDLAPRLYA